MGSSVHVTCSFTQMAISKKGLSMTQCSDDNIALSKHWMYRPRFSYRTSHILSCANNVHTRCPVCQQPLLCVVHELARCFLRIPAMAFKGQDSLEQRSVLFSCTFASELGSIRGLQSPHWDCGLCRCFSNIRAITSTTPLQPPIRSKTVSRHSSSVKHRSRTCAQPAARLSVTNDCITRSRSCASC